MNAEECPHGDDRATCPPCRREAGKDATLAVPPAEYGQPFHAMFGTGWCPGCNLPMHRGDTIRSYITGAREGYVHATCEV